MTVSKKAKYNKVVNNYGKATITCEIITCDRKVCTFCKPYLNFDYKKVIMFY